jgi:enoyl-CoA hydratase/carnithine racemase
MTDHIMTAQRDGVLQITINRPERKNALTRAMYTTLADALEFAAQDPAVRVLSIEGHPECFSAGNDMADFVQMSAGAIEADFRDQPVFRFLMALNRFPKPVLAGVCGPAVGIGTTLLLHCDYVVVGRNARFSTPFVSLGLCSEAGASVLLPRLVGPRIASAMLLGGRSLGADEALQYQLATEVADVDQVHELVHQRAAHMASLPGSAIRAIKGLMALRCADVPSVMAAEAQVFSSLLAGDAAREAFSAFLQKRKPDFSTC